MKTTSRPRPPELIEIDQKIGHRLRQRRIMIGMSQEQLGEAIGLTFQQVQKYEKGANRISGSRIVQLSRVLGVPPSYFFEDLEQPMAVELPHDTARMLELWARLTNGAQRRNILGIISQMVRPVAEAVAG